jgi:hypothetical protein
MHIELNIVSILFRGSIFCLFSYKVYQTFIKDKLQAYLQSELQIASNEQIEFVEKDTLLLSSRKRLQGQLNQQKILFASLEKKYAQFVLAEQQVAADQEAAARLRVETMIKNRETQRQNLAHLLALRAAIPVVVEKTNEELVKFYDNSRSREILGRYLKTLA